MWFGSVQCDSCVHNPHIYAHSCINAHASQGEPFEQSTRAANVFARAHMYIHVWHACHMHVFIKVLSAQKMVALTSHCEKQSLGHDTQHYKSSLWNKRFAQNTVI